MSDRPARTYPMLETFAAVDAYTAGDRESAEAEVAANVAAWRDRKGAADAVDVDDLGEDVSPFAALLATVTPGWHRDASCAGMPTAWWFADDGHVGNHGLRAKRICASCPVWRDCLTEAVDRGELTGVWGGAGGAALRELRRARAAGAEVWEEAVAAHGARLARHADTSATASDADEVVADVAIVKAFGANASHGVMSTYTKGCRCAPCQWVAARRARLDGLRERGAA